MTFSAYAYARAVGLRAARLDMRYARASATLRAHGAQVSLGVLLLAAGFLRFAALDFPASAEVFDERYYVNAARLLLHRPAAEPYESLLPGIDPNYEHPPLGKVLIALSMRVLGDGPVGWRTPSVIASLAAIVLVYALVCSTGRSRWIAVGAAALFAFDPLAFVLGRTATLDASLIALLLLGAVFYLRGHALLAGSTCGLAMLIKLTAGFGVLGFLVFETIGLLTRGGTNVAGTVRRCFRLVTGCAVVWLGLLWLLDAHVTLFQTPWDHIAAMIRHGVALSRSALPAGSQSDPWQWFVNAGQMTYYQNGNVVLQGAMNPLIVLLAPLSVGFVAWRLWSQRDALSSWVIAWIVAQYVSLCAVAAVTDRVMYIHYVLPTLPAIAVAAALLLGHRCVPLELRCAFGLAYGLCFLASFRFVG